MIELEDIKILNPGERLKLLRKELKVKQEELAGEKFSKNYISMFENNKRNINAINASYLAKKINEIATQSGKNINVTASYLLKNEEDMAKDKCKKWLFETESNLELSDYDCELNLYKIILVSSKYDLLHFKGRSLYLKGINSFNNQRFICAVTQFLDSIIYFAMENDFYSVKEVYKNIGITLFRHGNIEQSIVFFNLCESILKKGILKGIQSDIELTYYKALCYFKSGQNRIASKIIEDSSESSQVLKDLYDEINFINDETIKKPKI